MAISGDVWAKWLQESRESGASKQAAAKARARKKKSRERQEKARSKNIQRAAKQIEEKFAGGDSGFGEGLLGLSGTAWKQTDNQERAKEKLDRPKPKPTPVGGSEGDWHVTDTPKQPRQDQPGFWKDPLGIERWKSSDTAAKLRQDTQDAHLKRDELWGFGDEAARFDAAAKGGLDFVFDNPTLSTQDTVRGIGRESWSLALGRDVTDEEIGGAFQGAATSTKSVWDRYTPDSTVLRGAGMVTDAFIADPAKAGLRLGTGIDVDTGSTEGTVGALDAFDVGVTVGTAGVGTAGAKLATRAARSDEAAGLFRWLSRGDEAATTASRADGATDDVVRESVEAAEKATDPFKLSTKADEFAGGADETAAATDDLSGQIGKAIDEWSGRIARGTDEAARLTDEAPRLGDETLETAAKTTDEAGKPPLWRRAAGSRTARWGLPGAVAVGGGALIHDQLTADQFAVEDPDTGAILQLTKTESLSPTEDHDTGGTVFHVERRLTETTTDPTTGEARTVVTGYESQGYTVVLAIQGRTVHLLSADGGVMRSKVAAESWQAGSIVEGAS